MNVNGSNGGFDTPAAYKDSCDDYGDGGAWSDEGNGVGGVGNGVGGVGITYNLEDSDDDGGGKPCAVLTPSVSSTAQKLKRNSAHELWSTFTNDDKPHLKKSATCKHCKILFFHHKKSEQARMHLVKCQPFRVSMSKLDAGLRPDWLDDTKRANTSTPLIKDFMLPRMTKDATIKFQENIAMHYYMTGTSFQRVEEKHLKAAIKVLRPDNNLLPSRKQLSGPLLDSSHNLVKKEVSNFVEDEIMCLTSDGWSNIHNKPVVNYMATSSSTTLFLESVLTGDQGHTSEWIAQDIDRVIKLYPKTIFAGAITDNTTANKKAWALLYEMHPSMFFQGCTSHGLHLLVKDIFAATKTKKSGHLEPTYPTNYPFEVLLNFVEDCKDIVKLFYNSHALNHQLTSAQKSATPPKPALVRPAPTRWGSIKGCCESILTSDVILVSIVTTREFCRAKSKAQQNERKRIQSIVTNEHFVNNLRKVLAILKPIDALIVKYQSDKTPISEVWPDFEKLDNQFSQLLFDRALTIDEHVYISKLRTARFDFMYGKAHGLAYIFDPRYIGEGMEEEMVEDLEKKLIETPIDNMTAIDDNHKDMLYDDIMKYKLSALDNKKKNSYNYQKLIAGKKTPLQYWQIDGTKWPTLQLICTKLFNMATSSAASERNFSTMGFVHCKLRNKLAPDTIEKLIYIKTNFGATREDTDANQKYESEDEVRLEPSIDYESDESSIN